MRKSLLSWAALIAVTVVNLWVFLGRWAELPLSGIPVLLSERTAESLCLGLGLSVVVLGLLDHVWRKRWIGAVILLALAAAFIAFVREVPAFRSIFLPIQSLVLGSIVVGLACLRRAEHEETSPPKRAVRSFTLYTFASLNLFLIVAPFTTFTPAYVQDGNSPIPSFIYFYYGSVHSDVSMVSVLMRKLINFFFDYPSINATILSSMVYVAIGLACAALAFEMLFGAAWGWLLLIAAWTDRYILSGAIASSVVSMPILTSGSVFLLCVWSLIRRHGILSWTETWGVSAFNAVSLLYSLYSYSAARIPWLIGSAVAAVILLVRGAIPFNLKGLLRALATIVPSIILMLLILVFIFESDLPRFKAQLLISPKKEQIIKDVNDYHVKVVPMHDVDTPIWWGTGRPEGINVCLYWRRTPQEIYDKAAWFMQQIGIQTPIAPYILLLSGLALVVGVCSPLARWRNLSLISFLGVLGAYAPFILAQDTSAYRRALGTNLLVLIPIVAMFAARARRGLAKILAMVLCVSFCILKAPLELAPLFNNSLHAPLCIACHEHFNVRSLVNSEVYQSVKARPLVFVLDGKNIAGHYLKCGIEAIDSHEMKALSPNTRHLKLEGRSLAEVYNTLSPGEVLVAVCPTSAAPEGDMQAICEGTPPFGAFLGSIKDPNNSFHPRTKWVFIEKQT